MGKENETLWKHKSWKHGVSRVGKTTDFQKDTQFRAQWKIRLLASKRRFIIPIHSSSSILHHGMSHTFLFMRFWLLWFPFGFFETRLLHLHTWSHIKFNCIYKGSFIFHLIYLILLHVIISLTLHLHFNSRSIHQSQAWLRESLIKPKK